jgi:hypothetical protein
MRGIKSIYREDKPVWKIQSFDIILTLTFTKTALASYAS